MLDDDSDLSETDPLIDFPIVGVGASAGGLEAVTEMFRDIEKGTGMAFVLVMHLDPDHESLMVELLGRKMQIDVRQIADGDPIQVDCLHVIPPGSSLSVEDGRFRLVTFSEPRGLRRPIDSFFVSLAHTQGHRAACVVLSGTGADGTAGIRTIKEYGGVCAVQSPEEARYDGMPFSAISTKLVDFTLNAAQIVPRIQNFFEGSDKKVFPSEDDSAHVMDELTAIIQIQLGHDFSGYKRSTLFRRLFRRLQVLEYDDPKKYLEFIRNDASEQQALAQDFLINVTSFFRDQEMFEILQEKVIVPLIQGSEASDEVRIWVPGCSSGQEAYSIAMMIDETCEELQIRPLVTIFATDIDASMIAHARKGQYAVSAFNELPTRYQGKYVVGLDGKFEIAKKIREMVRFSVHNMIQDPPFSKIDLISCRNVLIYFGEELQKELFPLLHFSLKPGGVLFLGNSENVSRRGELFSSVDQKAQLFRRQNLDKRLHIHLPLGNRARGLTTPTSNKMTKELDFPRHKSLDASNLKIYEQYAPPFVRVAHDGRILDSSGDLSLFLMSRPGEERDLGSLARNEVRHIVLPLVSEAANEERRRAAKDVEISSPFGIVTADIVAHPLNDGTVAVVFIVSDRLKPIVDEYEHVPITPDRRIADLQEELQTSRLLLKSKVEEIETANEELKSSNEEMMSMNEELQSANEELTTANEELKNKIDELTLANADLDNFMKSTDLAMVVLDRALRIRHVTEAARRIMPIKDTDHGRALSEFSLGFADFDILSSIQKVITSGETYEHTTGNNQESQSYFIRVTPYFFGEGMVEGASLTVVDISSEVELRRKLTRDTALLNLAMQGGQMGFGELDMDTGMAQMDELSAQQMGLPGAGSYSFDNMMKHWNPDDVIKSEKARLDAVRNETGFSIQYRVKTPEGQTKWFTARGARINEDKETARYAVITIDLTDEIQMRHDLHRESDRLKLAMRAGRMGLAELDVESDTVTIDTVFAKQFGLDGPGVIPMSMIAETIAAEDRSLLSESMERAIELDEEYEIDFRLNRDTDAEEWIRTRGLSYKSADGRKKVVGPTIDVTATKRTMRQQETLVSEMNHRIKNLFAVISAMVQSAPKESDDTKQFANDLVGRIVSLGRAYDLFRSNGELGNIKLDMLLRSILSPHLMASQLTLTGPEVEISEHNITTLTLVLHELATNAAKHGAIQNSYGTIEIAWSLLDDGQTRLTWRERMSDFESGDEEPGFGTSLITTGMTQLKGEFERRYHDDGAEVLLNAKL
ncbi:MAG: CheR family methyltransferase [Pseudomonadota bacterium]